MSNVRALAVLEESGTIVAGRPRSGRRTSRCSQPACLRRSPGLSVPQAGGQRKFVQPRKMKDRSPRLPVSAPLKQNALLRLPLTHVVQHEARSPTRPSSQRSDSNAHALFGQPASTNRCQCEGQSGCANVVPSQSRSASPFIAVSQTPLVSGSTALTHRPSQERFVNQLPNPSVEGTSTIRLRLLAAAPHLKR